MSDYTLIHECPRCNRHVPSGAMRGFLWWSHCRACKDPKFAAWVDFLFPQYAPQPTNDTPHPPTRGSE